MSSRPPISAQGLATVSCFFVGTLSSLPAHPLVSFACSLALRAESACCEMKGIPLGEVPARLSAEDCVVPKYLAHPLAFSAHALASPVAGHKVAGCVNAVSLSTVQVNMLRQRTCFTCARVSPGASDYCMSRSFIFLRFGSRTS